MYTSQEERFSRGRRVFTALLSFSLLLGASTGVLYAIPGRLTGRAASVGESSGNDRKEDGIKSIASEYSDDDPNAFYGTDGTIKKANRKYEDGPLTQIRVSNLSPQVTTDLDYVDVWYSPFDDSRYLFLPATADRSNLVVDIKAAGQTVTLNGTALTSGKATDIFAGGDEFALKVGQADYGTLHVMQSDLKVMYLSTPTGGTEYLDVHWYAEQTATTLMLTETGAVSYSGNIEKFSRHGNSSWDYSKKKPYNIKLPAKADLYGMGKAKKWVLLSNYLDQSMLRNVVVTEMGRKAGADVTMDCTFVDLFCDGSYRGTYQLTEKPQIQKNRVNITDLEELTEGLNAQPLDSYEQGGTKEFRRNTYKYWNIPNNPADITGGYLLQFQLHNRYAGKAASGFVTSRGQTVQLSSPEYASRKQVEYIRSFVQDMEDAIYSPNGCNAKGKHYSEYIDVDSLIIGYLLQEISQNVDATYTSFFLYKESDKNGDGKLHYGPAWDFDLSFYNFSIGITSGVSGNPDQQKTVYSGRASELFAAYFPMSGFNKETESDTTASGIGWIQQLYTHDDAFVKRVSELYYERFDGQLLALCDTSQEGGAGVTQLGEYLAASAEMNNARWHMYGNKPYKILGPYNGETYAEIVEFLRHRVELRRDFLRTEWLSAMTDRLVQELPDALQDVDLTRYDPEGRRALDALIAEGQEAIGAAKTLEAAKEAYAAAVESLNSVPRKEFSGDFDESMHVDARDAQLLLQYHVKQLAGLDVQANSTQLRNGDVDKNSVINAADAMHIMISYTAELAGKSYPLPVVSAEKTE